MTKRKRDFVKVMSGSTVGQRGRRCRKSQSYADEEDDKESKGDFRRGLRVSSRIHRACTMCRRLKMRCEGPSNGPCNRCQSKQVECVFEKRPTNVLQELVRQNSERIDAVERAVVEVKCLLEDIRDSFAQLKAEGFERSILSVSAPNQLGAARQTSVVDSVKEPCLDMKQSKHHATGVQHVVDRSLPDQATMSWPSSIAYPTFDQSSSASQLSTASWSSSPSSTTSSLDSQSTFLPYPLPATTTKHFRSASEGFALPPLHSDTMNRAVHLNTVPFLDEDSRLHAAHTAVPQEWHSSTTPPPPPPPTTTTTMTTQDVARLCNVWGILNLDNAPNVQSNVHCPRQSTSRSTLTNATSTHNHSTFSSREGIPFSSLIYHQRLPFSPS